ncbi:MAG: RagB/SusD family nutrient uptake outer membrane protein [Bacteroidota bacterium]
MRKIILLLSISLFTVLACNTEEFLEREPFEVLTDEDIWNDPDRILSLLANYYNRLPEHASLQANFENFAAYIDATWSGGGGGGNDLNDIPDYDFDFWELWDYNLIRDINLAIENIAQFSQLSEDEITEFQAELRFLRAYVYFELVKRMGGVPLITQTLDYDFSGDPSSLQFPRNTEQEVYDFIGAELDAILDDLGNDGSQSRANRFTALALKSRAMLYAGSIAKYNNLMGSPLQTANGEIGIPTSAAEGYYQQALAAAEEILQQGSYQLYQVQDDLGENFYEALTSKQSNSEVIFARDYVRPESVHIFTYLNIPRPIREDNLSSSSITPTLNLVEAYQYLDGSSGEIITRTADDSDYVYYDNLEDIFANKDARLYGTVIYPGATFNGLDIEMQAGVKIWDEASQSFTTDESADIGTRFEDGGILTGEGGPHRTQQSVSNTGFYLRKFVDDAPAASTRGAASDMWWVKFRLGEVYLNAAEAAFELGDEGRALNYINPLRERAGFGPNSLSTLTVEDIRRERRVELAFEDHRIWDLKRWRIAHELWDGNTDNPEAVAFALYPYRVVRPGHPTDNTFVYDKIQVPRFRAPRFFRLGNYYSFIPDDVLNQNPKIVRNPFQ